MPPYIPPRVPPLPPRVQLHKDTQLLVGLAVIVATLILFKLVTR